MKKYMGIIYALITFTLWGTVATVSKIMLKDITNFQLMFYVSLFSTLSMFFIVLLKNKVKKVKNMIRKDYLYLCILGIIGLGIYQFFYFTAFAKAPVAQINVLNYFWPILILLLSVIINKQNLSFKVLLSFIFGIVGVAIVITQGNFFSFEIRYLEGYLFALGSAFCWAIFSVLNNKKKYEPISALFIFNLIGLLFMILVMIFTKSSFQISLRAIIGTGYIGIFPTALAYLIWFKALRMEREVLIANLAHLTPFISLLFIFLVLGEKILASEIIGLIIIVAGILLQIKREKQHHNNYKEK